MKTFVKIIFYLNFLLTGGAFMFSFCQFVLREYVRIQDCRTIRYK